MRTGHALVSRAAYYDRNTVEKWSSLGAVDAPHGSTTRLTYTVPSGKKAYGEVCLVYIERATAASVLGTCYSLLRYTPNGGSVGDILRALLFNNTIRAMDRQQANNIGLLSAGDVVTALTSDSGTDGTITNVITFKAAEFDA
jgi:hypothetical protein